MSTQTRESANRRPRRLPERPPLNSGDRLTRAEFERRYQAHPEIKKAELVEGIVYVQRRVHYEQHARPHAEIVTWVGTYCVASPGVEPGDSSTVRLDFKNEVQPDALLRLETGLGGRSRITEDDYLEGSPELIAEIAPSSAAYDLHDKHRAYARNGVQEYIVVQMYEQRIDWFVLRDGVYETLEPAENGVLRSEVFPGLWLQPAAFWAGDWPTLMAVLQDGLASPEHAAFVERLRARQTTGPFPTGRESTSLP